MRRMLAPVPPGRLSRTLPLLLLVGALAPALARAGAPGAGQLDPGFGAGGRVFLEPFRRRAIEARALLIQPDGKLVVGGNHLNLFLDGPEVPPHRGSFALARLHPDGRLDRSFGDAGIVLRRFRGFGQLLQLVLQPDGKLLVGGWQRNRSVLARYHSSGRPDRSFGTAGLSYTFGRVITGLAVQKDGRIVAAGFADTPQGTAFAVGRYLPSGMLDPSFGDGGRALTAFAGTAGGAGAVILQPDGRIVAAGSARVPSRDEGFAARLVLVRYGPDGTLDPTFGQEGQAISPLAPDGSQALALQPDGKIVVASTVRFDNTSKRVVLRYSRDGTPDPAFGHGGMVIDELGGVYGSVGAILIQPDGRIVVAGEGGEVSWSFPILLRYHPDGSPDTGFGTGGLVTLPTRERSEGIATALALQPDGKLAVAGFERHLYPTPWAFVARLLGGF